MIETPRLERTVVRREIGWRLLGPGLAAAALLAVFIFERNRLANLFDLAISTLLSFQGLVLLATAAAAVATQRLFKVSTYALGVSAMAVAHMFLADLDIGPFSLRIHLAVGLMALLAVTAVMRKRRLALPPMARKLALIYSLFILWHTLNMYHYGLSTVEVISFVAPRHLLALSVLLLAATTLTAKRDVVFFLATVVIAISISSAFSVMQWAGIDWAWEVSRSLRVQDPSIRAWELGASSIPPGLALYSISQSYFVMTFGLVGLTWVFFGKGSWRTVVPMTVVPLAVSAGLVLSFSRGALVASIVAVLFLLIIGGRWPGSPFRRRQLVIAVLLVVIAMFVLTLRSSSDLGSEAQDGPATTADKYITYVDERRSELLRVTLAFAPKAWFWGAADQFDAFFDANASPRVPRGNSPHNLFLNAIVFTGMVGFALIVALTLVSLTFAINCLRRSIRSPRPSWLHIALPVAFCAYMFQSQFHNAGFVNGDPLPWFILGLMTNLQFGPGGGTRLARDHRDTNTSTARSTTLVA